MELLPFPSSFGYEHLLCWQIVEIPTVQEVIEEQEVPEAGNGPEEKSKPNWPSGRCWLVGFVGGLFMFICLAIAVNAKSSKLEYLFNCKTFILHPGAGDQQDC